MLNGVAYLEGHLIRGIGRGYYYRPLKIHLLRGLGIEGGLTSI